MTTDQFTLGAGNQDQFRAWNGDEGHQWAANAAYYDTAVRQHHQRLMQAAAIGPDDRVLDVGCGTGQCTHDAARRAVRGAALGIDLSLPMIRMATATARGEGLPNASFVRGDAQVHPFPPRTFDIAVSRFGSMFFSDQVGALTNIGRALRPHGRLLLVSWRSARENDWISVLREALLPGAPAPEATTNTPGPFRHADRNDTMAILAASGYAAICMQSLDVPMHLGRDADDAFAVLGPLFAWMVHDLDPPAARRAFDRMRAVLRSHQTADGVALGSAAWLITARRSHTPPRHREAGA